MGNKNKVFFLDHESGAGLTNKLRLRVQRSTDAAGGGPTHRWFDLHSTYNTETEEWEVDDVPISESDIKAIRLMCKIAVTLPPSGAAGDAIRDVMRAQWGDGVTEQAMAVFTNDGTEDADAGEAVFGILGGLALIAGIGGDT